MELIKTSSTFVKQQQQQAQCFFVTKEYIYKPGISGNECSQNLCKPPTNVVTNDRFHVGGGVLYSGTQKII